MTWKHAPRAPSFLETKGVTENEFNAAYDSMTVAVNMQRAEQLTRNYAIANADIDRQRKYSPAWAKPAHRAAAIADQRSRGQREESLAHVTSMLSAFVPQPQGLARLDLRSGAAIPAESIWLDLVEPTPSEEKQVESFLSIDVPTRDEMREIEASNRLYEEDGALYMTATVVTKLDSDLPRAHRSRSFFRRPNWSRIATWIRCRSGASSHMPSATRTPATRLPRSWRVSWSPLSIASPT
jgi:Mg2+ and Co2+ transporter CorA